ncbi:MAG: GNAT family N-acetyltransferase [Candidatus Amulumruptor caecigallinarius]|nr:GNAT family N-acetyltransferase [Candidatus Amulumruptor caecigallinarius]MCM1396715.1 GNAT family N-acetyltransferase [Candidatus Amulumruptor caecigallinarius]MCM1453227.1 GNAT family N-acetyltransferase [bacterium]
MDTSNITPVNVQIMPAGPGDARDIARAIVMAVTPELCMESFGQYGASIDDVTDMFAALAARDDTQYSYLNSLIARCPDGSSAGVVVAYDGARLRILREVFIRMATSRLGMQFPDVIPDETGADEYYIDTLAVWPEHRGNGVAKALLRGAIARAQAAGKPAGLLVEKDNAPARTLYQSMGFRYMGDRNFFGTMMDHLQLPSA